MKVSPDYREILYLHYCERYKVQEIAAILGRNPNTVKVMLKRGRDMLRAIYGGETQ
jgi:RNA polymerase sigma-70 factor (ECF subfamily)